MGQRATAFATLVAAQLPFGKKLLNCPHSPKPPSLRLGPEQRRPVRFCRSLVYLLDDSESLRADWAQSSCRVAGDHGWLQELALYDRSCSDDAMISKHSSLENDRTCADEDVSPNHNGIVGVRGRRRLVAPPLVIYGMKVCVGDRDVCPEHRASTDLDSEGGANRAATDADVIPNEQFRVRCQCPEHDGVVDAECGAPGVRDQTNAFAQLDPGTCFNLHDWPTNQTSSGGNCCPLPAQGTDQQLRLKALLNDKWRDHGPNGTATKRPHMTRSCLSWPTAATCHLFDLQDKDRHLRAHECYGRC